MCDDNIDNDCDGIIDTDCLDDVTPIDDTFFVTATVARQPVDFMMVVDNSGSMGDTVAQIEQNLNAFANRLDTSGIDYTFSIVAAQGTNHSRSHPICIAPPMATGGCGSNLPKFQHLNQFVGSFDAFERFIQCFDGCNGGSIASVVRPNSLRQIIIVTDDESDEDWSWFQSRLDTRLNATRPNTYNVNSVVGLRRDGCVARVGSRYMDAARATGGAELHICDNNWGTVIDVLFENTVSQLNAVFPLSGCPYDGTIEVYASTGGPEILIAADTYAYDPMSRTLSFNAGQSPPNGTAVRIHYIPRECP